MNRPAGLMSVVSMLAALLTDTPALSAEVFADFALSTTSTTNAFMNSDQTGDIVISPEVAAGVDFGKHWTFGYFGDAAIWTANPDMFSHAHALFISVNPSWGKDRSNDFLMRLTVETQRYTATFSGVNNVRPLLETAIRLEPVDWFRWSLNQSVAFDWFYDDRVMDYLDSWTKSSFQFTAPSRTTLTPRIAFGYRRYLRQGSQGAGDKSDQQVQAGLHFSQGLWKNAGMQADYSYTHAFGQSGLIGRKASALEFNYLEETFLFTGHSARAGLKQIIADAWQIEAGVQFETRMYPGWVATDETGASTGSDRQDSRLGCNVMIQYVWIPPDDAKQSVPAVKVFGSYAFVRQWSNHASYDTDRHLASIGTELSW